MLAELINQRKKYFAAKRAEQRRNKPPTQAQQRTYMSNYIKNMRSYTLKHLRGYLFDEIKSLFEATMKMVNTFVPIEGEDDRAVPKLAAESSKRPTKEELDQESSKRFKNVLENHLGWQSYRDTDDELWKLQKHIHDITWRLYDTCGVHYVSTKDGVDIYMLIEREYPLSRESRDEIFDENRFSSIPRPKDVIPNSVESQRDDYSDDVPSEGLRDQVGSQYSYCYSIEEDPRSYNEAMQSRDATFWKEAIDDEIGSIMENNIWVLSDLPLGCKPLGCKWIFNRKMKVDGTINKFKARLVIQGFKQKEGIDYFDAYAPVACITTIILLLALAAVHNLVIHQMDVKTTFLNGDLDEKVYMKQPEGFVMPGEADVILGIKIKRENKGIVITQFQYIEKILKKFNHEDCSPVSTPMDPVEKLKPNTGKPVDQLEYSRAISCLMYAMTSTRPDIAYAVGRMRSIVCTGKEARMAKELDTRDSQFGQNQYTNFYHFDSVANWLKNHIVKWNNDNS
ncbi:zinc finger, CCHC-type containing protein [Tanacetum coccineum]